MAKKKGKKNAQKQVEVTSAPGSPKPAPAPAVEEPVPEVTEPFEPETPAVRPIPDEQPELTTEVLEAEIDEAIEGPTSEPTTQEAADLEVPPSEEQKLAEVSSPKDEAITEPSAEPVTEAEAPATDETTNPADEPKKEVVKTTTEPVEQPEEAAIKPSEPAEDTAVAVEPEAVAEHAAKPEIEATKAPVEEQPALASEVPAEAEQSSAAEQQDAEAPEITQEDGVNGHVEPAVVVPSKLLPAAEEPQPTVQPTEEAPAELAQQVPTEAALAEPQESVVEDHWAALPKKGKKNRKDKKKQAVTPGTVNEVVETPSVPEPPKAEPVAESEAVPVAEQPAEEQNGKLDAMHRVLDLQNWLTSGSWTHCSAPGIDTRGSRSTGSTRGRSDTDRRGQGSTRTSG